MLIFSCMHSRVIRLYKMNYDSYYNMRFGLNAPVKSFISVHSLLNGIMNFAKQKRRRETKNIALVLLCIMIMTDKISIKTNAITTKIKVLPKILKRFVIFNLIYRASVTVFFHDLCINIGEGV